MQEVWVISLSQDDPLEKEMAPHSSILAWRIPWQRSLAGVHGGPWGLESVGSTWSLKSIGQKELDMTERLSLFYYYVVSKCFLNTVFFQIISSFVLLSQWHLLEIRVFFL